MDVDYMLAVQHRLAKDGRSRSGLGVGMENKRSMASVLCTRCVAVRLKGGCYGSASNDTRLGWYSSSVDSFSADIVLLGTRVCPVCQASLRPRPDARFSSRR